MSVIREIMVEQPAFLQQQPEEQKKGIFKKEAKATGIDINQISNEMNNLSRRLRIIEERYVNIRTKTQVTDQNMLLNHKKLMNSINMLTTDMNELKREIKEIKDTLKLVIKELRETVKKEEVNALQKYIDLWDPANFVTREGVERVVNRVLDEKEKTL